MRLITAAASLRATFEDQLGRHKRISFAVAWASHGFSGYETLLKHQAKIERGTVGIHFYQTDPDFIEAATPNAEFSEVVAALERTKKPHRSGMTRCATAEVVNIFGGTADDRSRDPKRGKRLPRNGLIRRISWDLCPSI